MQIKKPESLETPDPGLVLVPKSPPTYWVRVIPWIDLNSDDGCVKRLEAEAGLSVCIYPSEEAANLARDASGGLVLEVTAASLRGKADGDEALLTSGDDHPVELEQSPVVAFMSLDYKTLPHHEAGDDEILFGSEATDWFELVEREIGFRLHR